MSVHRSRAVLLAVCMALACPGAGAEDPAPPQVLDRALAHYDFTATKLGQRLKYELTLDDGDEKIPFTIACVEEDADHVWIETDATTVESHPGTLMRFKIARKGGKILQAWWGKPGEDARAIDVAPMPEGKPGGDKLKAEGTGKVTTEVLRVKGGPFECEKVEVDVVYSSEVLSLRVRSTIWLSEEMPFVYDWRGKESAEGIEWEGKPSCKGGLVRLESEVTDEANGGERLSKRTEVLVDYGFDAVARLRIK
ncbi:MAG: hypothetical protein HYY18_10680 [Planctomycetes bacterium]|nr:hypothetical protein [Planctomycetota bacterium]